MISLDSGGTHLWCLKLTLDVNSWPGASKWLKVSIVSFKWPFLVIFSAILVIYNLLLNHKMTVKAGLFKIQQMYSMPQRVRHASLGNLEVLHHKANGSTIVFTHCEQENGITWPTFPKMAAEIHKKCLTTVLVFFNFWLSFWR